MNKTPDLSGITHLLSEWYKFNKRDLPWRKTTDPYQIWISEIILQQTRIEQGQPYFEAILERFPDVKTLASSPLDDLLKLWQGLGYYSRARNMHAAAGQIMETPHGKFPSKYEDLLKLKGVGEYTASAIASIAYKQPKAVVDGNVFRVLSRLFLIDTPINSTEGKKIFSEMAESILDMDHPDNHNQAMMDFGSMQCTPKNPECTACPLAHHCQAFRLDQVKNLPVKQPSAKKQERFFHYLVLNDGKSTWLQQRLEKDIWQQLWEFPLIESDKQESMETLLQLAGFKEWMNLEITLKKPLYIKHILSHRVIHAWFFPIVIHHSPSFPPHWKKVNFQDIGNFAVSRLTEIYLNTSDF